MKDESDRSTASKEKGNVLDRRGAGFLKREVLKPATGKDQTKFFCKRDPVSRNNTRWLVNTSRTFEGGELVSNPLTWVRPSRENGKPD